MTISVSKQDLEIMNIELVLDGSLLIMWKRQAGLINFI